MAVACFDWQIYGIKIEFVLTRCRPMSDLGANGFAAAKRTLKTA
jgi:hypothetical protein